MKPLVVHSEATTELEEAIAYYEQEREGLGLDLLTEVRRTWAQIQRNPRIATRHKGTQFRRAVVRRFPYLVFYAELEDSIWIVAVAHAKRRPDYWRRRRLE